MKQIVNTYLSMILIGSVALGASYIIIKFSQIDDFSSISAAEHESSAR